MEGGKGHPVVAVSPRDQTCSSILFFSPAVRPVFMHSFWVSKCSGSMDVSFLLYSEALQGRAMVYYFHPLLRLDVHKHMGHRLLWAWLAASGSPLPTSVALELRHARAGILCQHMSQKAREGMPHGQGQPSFFRAQTSGGWRSHIGSQLPSFPHGLGLSLPGLQNNPVLSRAFHEGVYK